MSDERTLGEWHVHVSPGKVEPVVLDAENRPVATVHGASEEEALKRALLIARAPTLRDAARACQMVFSAMAADRPSPHAEAAAEVLPMLESVLWNICEEADGDQPA